MFKSKKKKQLQKMKQSIEKSGLFDKVYYLKNNHDVRVEDLTPIEHYCQIGIKEDRKPNATFDPVWYREYYADVKADGAYPIIHYIIFGKGENRFQNKAESKKFEESISEDTISETSHDLNGIEVKYKTAEEAFDRNFYLNTYDDVKNAEIDPYDHYSNYGWMEGRRPNCWFNPRFYLREYKNVSDLGMEPLEHFVTIGQYENRKPDDSDVPAFEASQYKTPLEAFDEEFYLTAYADIKESGIDAYEHYSNHGWKERRNPNNWFDVNYYLNTNEDVQKSGIDPLKHYIEIGRFENRHVKEVIEIKNYDGEFKQYLSKISFDNTLEEYREFEEHLDFKSSVKTIAFYLPQFHPFPENDKWWGKGFTEWTNVSKAKANFKGHYQPHLPIHNGFYDLRVPEVMIEQAKLAKNYGIHGFNFYYYWFDGKILMHQPFEILFKHKEIDINFCITWANENWTRRWDGAENDILIGQNHCEDDSIKFIENLYKFFKDERYIRIDNKPLLIIYRVDIIPNMKATVDLWRRKAKEAGFDGLYLVCSQTFGITSPEPYGFDAAMEFPPHTVKSNIITSEVEIENPNYTGNIFDYKQVVDNACAVEEPKYKLFRTSMLSWDNTARKQDGSNTFYNFSLLKYKQWMSNIVSSVINNDKYAKEEKIVFVNAWNEWAEGTHLEPDRKYGYGYLQTTYDVLKNFDVKNNEKFNCTMTQKKNDIAVVLHIHYTDLWEDIKKYLNNLDYFGFDLFITLTNIDNNIVENIVKDYPDANLTLVENRGRDILPFIDTYKKIKNLKYKYVCKIHSKKSVYRDDGDNIRDELYESLLGSHTVIQRIIDVLRDENDCGLLISQKYLVAHSEKNMKYTQKIANDLSRLLGFNFEYFSFPAGSMFWFKPEAFSGIEKIESKFFQPEEGLADGTVAHGVERLFCSIVENNNFKIKGNDE